ncbi:hypothetical protein DMUE_1966 [Dictyocoela muelleri]|nr:hypothetical protein DMUE_1966 [Dictyocoela muelleri]
MIISKKTVQKIYKNLRKRTKIFFEENSYGLGNEGIICQIDESICKYKQKYFASRSPLMNRWVFGIVNTSEKPGCYFVTSVGNRSVVTLLPIINQICRPGSIIWSDEWRGYSNLQAQGYNHETADHSYDFINPQNGVNTQTIESLWNKLKRRLKKFDGM